MHFWGDRIGLGVYGALPAEQFHSMDITPVIGAHIGPGAVGYAIISKNPV